MAREYGRIGDVVNLQNDDSIEALRNRARRRLPKAVFDFIDGGAETEATLKRNSLDFEQLTIEPHCFVDVSDRDLATSIIDRRASMPLIIGPTGLAALTWPKADLALARAAEATNVPFVVSTSSSVRLEEVASAAPSGRRWMQIYPYKDQNLVKSLIARARACEFEALVITIDTPVLGYRSRDHRNGFSVPLRPNLRLLWDVVRCKRWTWGIIRHGIPRMQNFVEHDSDRSMESLSAIMNRNMNPGASWCDLAWIRDAWDRKLVLKGVLTPAGAETAVREGLDAIVISNHGGRQLDGAPSTISVLSRIARVVNNRLEIYIDGGVRRGVDIAKALALGAHSVMIGRAALYGVAAGGELGARHALELLRSEYDRSLALLGCRSSADLTRSMVRRACG